MLNRVLAWLRSTFLRGRLDREMREELAGHLEQSVARLQARGLSRVEAERTARREFGSLDLIEEQGRDERGSRWLESMLADVRFALRQFRRTPLATATMVLVLALGIGANTGLFTVLHSMWTAPPPGIPRDASLVWIQTIARHRMSHAEVMDYAAQDRYFEGVSGWTDSNVAVDLRGSQPGLVPGRAVYVTSGYFDVLGVRPDLGSTGGFDGGGASYAVAAISDAMWRQHFGASRDVLGRVIRVNDAAVTIVAVAPPGFTGAAVGSASRTLWLPLAARATVEPGAGGLAHYDSIYFQAAARLANGVSMAEALPAVQTIAARAVEQAETFARWPEDRALPSAQLAPLRADNAEVSASRDWRKVQEALLLGGITLLILLITCTNASGLLVGSGLARRREIAVRLSLGAGRKRLIRQLVTESVILALAAAALGMAVLWTVTRAAAVYFPDVRLVIEWAALLFTLGFATVTGLLFGISPALHATRLSVSEVLKDAAPGVSHSRMSLQRGLIVGQIALTQPLLAFLGIMIVMLLASINYRASSPLADRIVTMSFSNAGFQARTPEAFGSQRERFDAELERLRAELAAEPGVVAAVRHVGYGIGMGPQHRIHPADRVPGGWDDQPFVLSGEAAMPGYLALMGIPIVAGRDFDRLNPERDSSAVLIGAGLARRLWSDADPVGRRLVSPDGTRDVHVIGVYDDEAAGGGDTGNGYRVFRALGARMPSGASIRLRTAGLAASMLPQLRVAAFSIAPNLPILSTVLFSSELASRRREMLIGSGAAGAGGLLALFLSAIGLYALVSLAVTQRMREIGIRTALGAERGDVVRLFFGSALKLAGLGLTLGLPLSLIALRLLRLQLDMPNVRMDLIGLAVAIGVIMVAAAATWIPARRAASVDPVQALRESVGAEAG